ncbi:YCF48-related protein [Marispirochaeta aestuarii]|uniref:TipJ family phage tail tip protein n=1 Tax=Marispirochaeta aestuarii TaxID=1963862 RepID=UPI002ABD3C90|nr:YCF48-related protein [Marispirochaeta aestuarii]
MSDKLRVSILNNPFSIDREDREVKRISIKEILESSGLDLSEVDALVIDKDIKVPEDQWDKVPESDHLIIRAIPKGDAAKGLFGGGIFTAFVGAILLFTPLAPVGLALLGAGVSMAIGGVVLMNIDIPSLNDRSQETAPSVRGARNQTRIGEATPIILGKHLVTPDNAALPFTSIVGDDQYVSQLFCHGSKDVIADESTMKFGETPVANYNDVSYEFQYGTNEDNTYFPSRVIETTVQLKIENSSDPIIRRTSSNTRKIGVVVSFPQGLIKYDKEDGDKKNYTVNYQILWKKASSETWNTLYDGGLTARKPRTIRRYHEVILNNSSFGDPDFDENRQYDVRVVRLSGDTDATNVIDDLYWDVLQSWTAKFDGTGSYDDRPIAETAQMKLGLIGLNLRASDQLQGAIDQLNYIAQLHTLAHNEVGTGPTSWEYGPTSNPAALFRYVLQDSYINPEPVPDSKIDWPVLEEWFAFCKEKGFECNAVVIGDTTINDLLNFITSTGRATWSQIDGKYTVIIDKENPIITQYFTPRNSWDFTGHRAFNKLPTTLRMQFIDESIGYVEAERLVAYDPDTHQVVYDEEIDAGEVQDVNTFGITKADHVAKIGAYQLAVAWLRPEQYEFNVDIEYLICTRGDRVQLTHDVPLFGLGSGRVSAVFIESSDTVGIRLDTEVKLDFGVSYGVVIRIQDGSSITKEVENPAVDVPVTIQNMTFTTPISGTDLIHRDDLVMFGEVGKETRDLVVMKIEPGPDLSAKLTCVDYNEDIFNADQGTIPPWDPGISRYESDVIVPVGIDVPNPGQVAVEAINNAAEVEMNSLSPEYYAIEPGGPSPTTVPSIPVLSGSGIFRGFQIDIEPQQNLMNPLRIELQVSEDQTDWFSLGYGTAATTDWYGELNAITRIPEPAKFFVHAPTPFVTHTDGNGQPYVTGRTLHYRARRRTRSDVVSDWSEVLTLTSSVIEDGTIGLDAIIGNMIKAGTIDATRLSVDILSALVAQITDRIEITNDGIIGESANGDRRIVITNDEMRLQVWNGSTWDTVQQIGGVVFDQFLPWFFGSGLVDKAADLAGIVFGIVPDDETLVYRFDDDYGDESNVDPWTKSNVQLSSEYSKFFTKSLTRSGADGSLIQSPPGMDITGAWSLGGWLRTDEAGEEVAVFKISGMSVLAFVGFSLGLLNCNFDAPDLNSPPTNDEYEEIIIPGNRGLLDTPTTDSLRSVATDGKGTWIVVGMSGVVFRSVDGGETWGGLLSVPVDLNTLTDVATDRAGVWIVVGTMGVVFRSTDNGATWSSLIDVPTTNELKTVETDGNGVWVAAGAGGHLFRSTDNGVSWGDLLSTPTTASINCLATDCIGTWVAAGADGHLFRSIDNGATWGSLLPTPTAYAIQDIATDGMGNWIALGSVRETFRSVDNGATWGDHVAVGITPNYLWCIDTDGAGTWFLGGTGSELHKSVDNGLTWSAIISSPSTETLYSLCSDGGGTWVFVGSSGQVFSFNGNISRVLNQYESWTAEVTGPDEITITAAWPGKRASPVSPELSIETVEEGYPDRTLVEVANGTQKIMIRAFNEALRLLAIDEATFDFIVGELPWSVAYFGMFHIGSDGAGGLWFKTEGQDITLNIASLEFTSGVPTVSLLFKEAFNNYCSETWLHPSVDLDHSKITEYRQQNQPWGNADIRDTRIQARDGRDIYYVTTGGGKHKFIGEVEGAGGSGGGSSVSIFKEDNPTDQKDIRFELTASGLQLNLYDDAGNKISTIIEQSFDTPTNGLLFSAPVYRKRWIGDALGIIYQKDSEVAHSSGKAWQTQYYISATKYYGEYRASAQLYGSSTGIYYRVLINDVEVGRVSHSGGYTTYTIDFEVGVGDRIELQTYQTDNDLGDIAKIRYQRLLADSNSIITDYLAPTTDV